MSTNAPTQWFRVTRRRRCPVCGKPDWCTVSADGKAALCPRTPSDLGWRGQEGGGYLHKLDGSPMPEPRPAAKKAKAPPALSPRRAGELAAECTEAVDPDRLAAFSADMGLEVESLRRLSIGYADRLPMWSPSLEKELRVTGWVFPMFDSMRSVTGLRIRTESGRKFSYTGGAEGVFLPSGLHWAGRTLWCFPEGPTSTAALLDLGFDAVGRPSCSGGTEILIRYLSVGPKRDVVVLGDHDATKRRPDGSEFRPGQDGATRLAGELAARRCCASVKVLVPPFDKDARDWKRGGATKDLVEACIRAQAYVMRRSA